ncbi:MAG: universal stress protein [Chitinophagaceae bacterium]
MKTLIVPTDFSPVAINAMNYAAEMAKSIQASILLTHVYQVPVTFSEVPVPIVPVEELKKTAEDRLKELKEKLTHTYSGKLKVYTEAILGEPIDELFKLCRAIHPFAVVMGTHGTSGLEKMIMGSTTLSAIRHLDFPVLAIPPGTTFHAIKKIGLACDLKNVIASTPISFIKSIVEEFHADLQVLHVDYDDQQAKDEVPLESAHLESLLGAIRPTYHFLKSKDLVQGINEFAEKNNLNLVMVIPKKHKLLESLFHKSGSAGLVTHSHIPVMSIHE